jgi:carbonic anhydrase
MKTQLFMLLAATSLFACKKPMAEVNEQENQTQRLERIIKDESYEIHSQVGQSPIDIQVNNTQKFFSKDPVFHYKAFTLNKVKNTGDNLKVYVNGDNYITIKGNRYDLQQFHFHRSSEHALQGKKGPLEVHLVHVASDNSIAVVGVILQKGGTHTGIQTILDGSPHVAAENNISPKMFHPADLLPVTSTPYFTYSGSLTTNPFTENLTWIVYKQPIQVSAAQIAQYNEIYEEEDSRIFQPIGNRRIFERVGSN